MQKLDLALPIEQWVRVLEQVMVVMLLVGRWLLPKGEAMALMQGKKMHVEDIISWQDRKCSSY